MKGKKLLSMFTAGALAVTMAMPAMAADGGEVDVDVTTKTGILRVEVPTTLAVAVDQFETTDVGTQIYSEEFIIANKSEVNVKVGITSTATVKDDVALAAKKSDVTTATAAGGTAWVAVAASLDGTKYEAAGDLGNLNESSANVTTFAKNGTAVTAAQTFYLKKGTANSAAYKLLKPSADGKNNDVSYAQFYKLTALAAQPGSDDDLQKAVNASDVYVVVTADAGTDGKPVTKIAKGETVASSTYANTNTYYTAADAATANKDLKAADIYTYGELTQASTGADAAFRYIGTLSKNKEVWDATDISKVKIAYTIQGLPQSDYEYAENAGEITYGLYKEDTEAPSIGTKSYAMTANTAIDITVDLGKGSLAATGVSKVMDPTGAWDYLTGENQASYDAASKKITLSAGMVDACISANVSHINVIFNDAAATTVKIDLTK